MQVGRCEVLSQLCQSFIANSLIIPPSPLPVWNEGTGRDTLWETVYVYTVYVYTSACIFVGSFHHRLTELLVGGVGNYLRDSCPFLSTGEEMDISPQICTAMEQKLSLHGQKKRDNNGFLGPWKPLKTLTCVNPCGRKIR